LVAYIVGNADFFVAIIVPNYCIQKNPKVYFFASANGLQVQKIGSCNQIVIANGLQVVAKKSVSYRTKKRIPH